MKLVLLILSSLLFFTAHADHTVYGTITFQEASTYVPANKVCKKGDYLFHKTKDFVTIETCNDANEICTTKIKPLKQKVLSKRKRCKVYQGGKCRKKEQVSFRQGSVEVNVYNNYREFDNHETPKDRFDYTVDRCD